MFIKKFSQSLILHLYYQYNMRIVSKIAQELKKASLQLKEYIRHHHCRSLLCANLHRASSDFWAMLTLMHPSCSTRYQVEMETLFVEMRSCWELCGGQNERTKRRIGRIEEFFICWNRSLSEPRGYPLCFDCLFCSGGSPNIRWSKSCGYALCSGSSTIQKSFNPSDSVFYPIINSSLKITTRPYFNKNGFHLDLVS